MAVRVVWLLLACWSVFSHAVTIPTARPNLLYTPYYSNQPPKRSQPVSGLCQVTGDFIVTGGNGEYHRPISYNLTWKMGTGGSVLSARFRVPCRAEVPCVPFDVSQPTTLSSGQGWCPAAPSPAHALVGVCSCKWCGIRGALTVLWVCGYGQVRHGCMTPSRTLSWCTAARLWRGSKSTKHLSTSCLMVVMLATWLACAMLTAHVVGLFVYNLTSHHWTHKALGPSQNTTRYPLLRCFGPRRPHPLACSHP